MELTKFLLDWSSSIAWPVVTLIIAIMFRTPVLQLFEQFGSIANRASKEAFDLQLGEKLKISFKESIESANPKTIEEALKIAETEAEKIINIYEILNNIPIQKHHKDLLLKVAKGGDKGIYWKYGGKIEAAPGRTMGHLLKNGLVHRDGNRYYAHSLVRDYIFKVHSK